MKIVFMICRYLLGLMFAVFGSNGFLHFIHQPPPGSALAGQFMGVVFTSHFMMPIFLLQLIAGVLLLVDAFVPLALVVLAGILINILDYHITMDPGSIAPGIVATILLIGTALPYRASFRDLFQAKTEKVT